VDEAQSLKSQLTMKTKRYWKSSRHTPPFGSGKTLE